MVDREKVIKSLETCSDVYYGATGACSSCSFSQSKNCFAELVHQTIALLKEQEAKQVIKQTYHVMMNRDYENPVEVTRYDWLCPTCKSLLCRDIDVIDDNYHFCKVCGQAVKWE